MRKLLVVSLTALALSACSSFDTGSKRIMAACASATASINIINDNFARISRDNINRISAALDVVTPICTSDNPPTVDDAKKSLLDSAVKTLLNVKESI